MFAGFPGHTHSAAVFRDSPISNELDALLHVPGGPLEDTYHIMGDSAYPSTFTTVATFKLVGLCNNPRIKKFNTHLASKRNVIEREFALLVSRWCCLLKLRCQSLQKDIDAILDVCILHNWCIMCNDVEDDLFNPQPVVLQVDQGYMGPAAIAHQDNQGAAKRLLLVDHVNQ